MVAISAKRSSDDADVARVRELRAKGMGRNEIAREMGIGPATASKLARLAGITFDRSATQVAVEARQVDNRARRAAIVARLYGVAERTITRLEADEHELTEVSMGQVVRYTAKQLPGPDVHRLVGAVNVATAAAVKLEQVDGDASTDRVGSLLGSLFDTLQARHGDGAAAAGDGDA